MPANGIVLKEASCFTTREEGFETYFIHTKCGTFW